jgi:hypothetical protein
MKVRFTGVADAAATYAGKYEVTTGSVLDVSETEANLLLQTGVFEVVEEDTDAKPKPLKRKARKLTTPTKIAVRNKV